MIESDSWTGKVALLILVKPRKVGWSDKGSRELHEGWENCQNTLKRGGTEKRVGEKETLNSGGQAG